MPKVRAKFYLSGENLDLSDITNTLGVDPTQMKKKHEWPKPSILAGIAQDVWMLQTEKENCKAISVQLDKLASILFSKMESIKHLQKKYLLETSVTIVVEMENGDAPEMILTSDIVLFLAKINAEVGFDLYID